jgi:hypothetical protein
MSKEATLNANRALKTKKEIEACLTIIDNSILLNDIALAIAYTQKVTEKSIEMQASLRECQK